MVVSALRGRKVVKKNPRRQGGFRPLEARLCDFFAVNQAIPKTHSLFRKWGLSTSGVFVQFFFFYRVLYCECTMGPSGHGLEFHAVVPCPVRGRVPFCAFLVECAPPPFIDGREDEGASSFQA